jgi:signal transduction histidine kinase
MTEEAVHAGAALREAKEQAEAANHAKDTFLAVLSHELRTPLTPVVMTISAFEIDKDMHFKFREDLAMVRRNIDLEVKLIDDLLDLSRITSGKLRLQLQNVHIHELLSHVLRSSVSETYGKRLQVREELGALTCSPNPDPSVMRVFEPRKGKEILEEFDSQEASYARADHRASA